MLTGSGHCDGCSQVSACGLCSSRSRITAQNDMPICMSQPMWMPPPGNQSNGGTRFQSTTFLQPHPGDQGFCTDCCGKPIGRSGTSLPWPYCALSHRKQWAMQMTLVNEALKIFSSFDDPMPSPRNFRPIYQSTRQDLLVIALQHLIVKRLENLWEALVHLMAMVPNLFVTTVFKYYQWMAKDCREHWQMECTFQTSKIVTLLIITCKGHYIPCPAKVWRLQTTTNLCSDTSSVLDTPLSDNLCWLFCW